MTYCMWETSRLNMRDTKCILVSTARGQLSARGHRNLVCNLVTSFDVEVPAGSSGCELMTPNLRQKSVALAALQSNKSKHCDWN